MSLEDHEQLHYQELHLHMQGSIQYLQEDRIYKDLWLRSNHLNILEHLINQHLHHIFHCKLVDEDKQVETV